MSKATVISKVGRITPNGKTKTLVLKRGNEVLGEVDYWSWSYVSEQNATHLIQQIAERHNITQIVWDNDN